MYPRNGKAAWKFPSKSAIFRPLGGKYGVNFLNLDFFVIFFLSSANGRRESQIWREGTHSFEAVSKLFITSAMHAWKTALLAFLNRSFFFSAGVPANAGRSPMSRHARSFWRSSSWRLAQVMKIGWKDSDPIFWTLVPSENRLKTRGVAPGGRHCYQRWRHRCDLILFLAQWPRGAHKKYL